MNIGFISDYKNNKADVASALPRVVTKYLQKLQVPQLEELLGQKLNNKHMHAKVYTTMTKANYSSPTDR